MYWTKAVFFVKLVFAFLHEQEQPLVKLVLYCAFVLDKSNYWSNWFCIEHACMCGVFRSCGVDSGGLPPPLPSCRKL